IPIKIPPLRDRQGDLPLLIKYFFRMKSKKLNKHLISMNADIYIKMINHNWPGNIRELENCIENIVNLNGENTIFFDDVKEKVENIKEKVQDNINKNNVTLEELEKQAIKEALESHNHNMSRIAKTLGITRATLYSKIKKYNI
ncbi:MAG: helix-turn-helix domain-containing protein, partial [Clostridiaceae bacterium]